MATAFTKKPVTGKPGGKASRHLRVDFRKNVFDDLIETKTARLGWARASLCPCRGYNPQSTQPKPDCELCNSIGFLYFRPAGYHVEKTALGKFTDEQEATLDRANAVVVRGFIQGMEIDPDLFKVVGNWAGGNARLTMRGLNRPGYFDRIISIDELMVYQELVKTDGSGALPTRYTVHSINLLRTLAAVMTDADITLVEGAVVWKSGKEPVEGTLVSINYLCHPVWLVQSHIHVFRSSLTAKRVRPEQRETPEGNLTVLPNQTMVRLEHLPPLDPG